MDEAAIESKSPAPIRSHLDAVAAIRDKTGLAGALGENLHADVDPLNFGNFHTPNLFGVWVAPGFNDSSHYAAYVRHSSSSIRPPDILEKLLKLRIGCAMGMRKDLLVTKEIAESSDLRATL